MNLLMEWLNDGYQWFNVFRGGVQFSVIGHFGLCIFFLMTGQWMTAWFAGLVACYVALSEVNYFKLNNR